MAGGGGVLTALGKLAFDASKHKRGQGGKFAFQGGSKKPAPKVGGSVASAHALFDKMKGQPKKDVLAAAAAAGINPNTAKTQLYHWQKKQAVAALGGKANPTKEDLQQAAAKALGVKPAVVAPKPMPVPKLTPAPVPKPAPKPPAEHKGYDHIVHGPGTAQEKADRLTKQFFEDFNKAKTSKEMQELQPHFNKAYAEIKELKTAEKVTLGTVTPKATPAPVAVTKSTDLPDLAKLGPTKYVHALADHMKGNSKKEVVAAAIKAGVHPSTAGVQYGKWAKAQAGEPPQLAKSPEPKALQAKQPQAMSDKELDEALSKYQGKLTYKADSATFNHPYQSKYSFSPNESSKSLTAKMGPNSVSTHLALGKTFYKTNKGDVFEHTGAAGPYKKVFGTDTAEYHYDPESKVTYKKEGGLLRPIHTNVPVFAKVAPPKTTLDDGKTYVEPNHAFRTHAWANANGIQDPNYSFSDPGAWGKVVDIHKKSGVIYNGTSKAVASYTSAGYKKINGELRNSKGTKVSAQAQEIDEVISKSSFAEDTVMWRGVGTGAKGKTWNEAPPPLELSDHGFTSVSYKPSVGMHFSNGKSLFRIKIPKGFPGLNVAMGQPSGGAIAGLKGEAEVMLPRGTTYRVVERHAAAAKNKSGNNYDVIDLEPVLPDWYIKKYGSQSAA